MQLWHILVFTNLVLVNGARNRTADAIYTKVWFMQSCDIQAIVT